MVVFNNLWIYTIIVIHLLSLSCFATYDPPLYKIWDTRRVPYTISRELNGTLAARARSAISQLQSPTCIKFEEKTVHDYDYLSIQAGDSCETYVGKYGGRQNLSLHKDCAPNEGEVMHELLHTLGFYHEHQRSDRDQYINVSLENVLRDKIEDDFQNKRAFLPNLTYLPYDYLSLTHYGPDQFSKDGDPTIHTRDPSKQSVIGQRVRLSDIDFYKVQLYYNCVNTPITDRCATLPPQPSNGTWVTLKGNLQAVGHVIEYTCKAGYTLVGPTNRSCLLDGTWLAYSPYCVDSPLMYCNFDNNNWCRWIKSYQGQESNYWYLNRRKTFDTWTGPNNDYTTMASKGYFAYVEASNAKNGDIALLTSPLITTSSQRTCFRFAYSMYGQYTGELSAFLLQGNSETRMFYRTGGQGLDWHSETIYDLPLDTTIQIQFRLKMRGLSKGDVALDDLLLTECHKLPL